MKEYLQILSFGVAIEYVFVTEKLQYFTRKIYPIRHGNNVAHVKKELIALLSLPQLYDANFKNETYKCWKV